jgi:hypothetical protein
MNLQCEIDCTIKSNKVWGTFFVATFFPLEAKLAEDLI